MDLLSALKALEQNLFLPKDLFSCEFDVQLKRYMYGIGYNIVDDCSMLSCGCCMAESLYMDIVKITQSELIHCPTCKANNVNLVGPVKPLRSLIQQIETLKSNLNPSFNSILFDENVLKTSYQFNTNDNQNILDNIQNENTGTLFPINKSSNKFSQIDNEYIRNNDTPKTNLLNLFFKVANQINNETSLKEPIGLYSEMKVSNDHNFNNILSNNTVMNSNILQKMDSINEVLEKKPEIASVMVSLTNKSNTMITERLSQGSINDNLKIDNIDSLTKALSPKITPLMSANYDEKKEYFFTKCFPIYRKRNVFKTHSKFLKTKSKLFINSSISPGCTKFALISKHKWEVYTIPKNHKKMETSLICCGRITGEFGINFDNLSQSNTKNNNYKTNNFNKDIKNDEFVFCQLSEELLIITDTSNSIRILDLNQSGKLIHFYNSKYPIRCIDIDPNGKIIACGITGKDRKNNSEQALITLHRIDVDEMTSKYEFLPPITIALPYRDPINTIQLSNDGQYVSCSTTMESRFLIISLRNVNEPRLIMKSLRSIDTSLESEGITDTKLFPGNSNLMCVTSTAFNSPPIIINTKIEDISNLRSVAQPTLLNKIVELGSKIHKCEISPRNDSIAFLDKNGSVYMMSAPTMIENEKKRIVLVDIVADAYRAHESASMKFSSDGHILYILDRKGVLYVENFAYNLPQNHEITCCKEIN